MREALVTVSCHVGRSDDPRRFKVVDGQLEDVGADPGVRDLIHARARVDRDRQDEPVQQSDF